jgi:hypothetical protein
LTRTDAPQSLDIQTDLAQVVPWCDVPLFPSFSNTMFHWEPFLSPPRRIRADPLPSHLPTPPTTPTSHTKPSPSYVTKPSSLPLLNLGTRSYTKLSASLSFVKHAVLYKFGFKKKKKTPFLSRLKIIDRCDIGMTPDDST